MKKKICLVLLVALFLTGCAQALPAAGTEFTRNSNIFQETTMATVPDTPSLPSRPPKQTDLRYLKLSFSGVADYDSDGEFISNTGGELCYPLCMESEGAVQTHGVGVLLFLDGRVQPYRLEGEETYTYLHIFHPESTGTTVDLYLTPITGQPGDTLEFYVYAMPQPDYLPSMGPATMMSYTSGALGTVMRVQFQASPPDAVFPEKSLRLTTPEISYVDVSTADVKGWSETDLRERVANRFYLNGQANHTISCLYGASTDSPLDLCLEVWGSPYVEHGVVFFVDNEPVFGPDGETLFLTIRSGQKTVVNTKLDMSDFSGESVVYAVLVPRNYKTSEILTRAFVDGTENWFVLSGENPNK